MKQLLHRLARRTPRPVIEAGYRLLEAVDRLWAPLWRRARGVGGALPPMRLRTRVGSRWPGQFLNAGRSCAEALQRAAADALGKRIEDHRAVLDFGCGCGRTLHHLHPTNPTVFHGCDVDESAIAWMKQRYDADRFVVSRFEPPLPFDDGAFDLIYSVSVFTHLNEASHLAWVRELHRVLSPGGAALLTIQGAHAMRRFLDGGMYTTESMHTRLSRRGPVAEEGFIFEPYETLGQMAADFPGIDERYGLSFHDAQYIRRAWGEWFELLTIREGEVDGLQDVAVVRRR